MKTMKSLDRDIMYTVWLEVGRLGVSKLLRATGGEIQEVRWDADMIALLHFSEAGYEFTLSGNGEVMVEVDLSDDCMTMDIYTHLGDLPRLTVPIVGGSKRKAWNPKWNQDRNKLFAHLPESLWKTFEEEVVENKFVLDDDLDALIESGELEDTIFKNPIIAALRDRG